MCDDELAVSVATDDVLSFARAAPKEIAEECVYYHPKVCRARGYGDPHIQTFDGLHYDAHTKGEVIMLKSLQSDLQIQARFEGLEQDGGSVGPSSKYDISYFFISLASFL